VTIWRNLSAFNQGLVGGIRCFDVVDFQVRGAELFAATAGAGVYARDLAGPGTWHRFGDAFEPNQASNVNSLALGGTRLLACPLGNGRVGIPAMPSGRFPIRQPGIYAALNSTAVWNGAGWVVGTNRRSQRHRQEP
jgi:hypothetical protein